MSAWQGLGNAVERALRHDRGAPIIVDLRMQAARLAIDAFGAPPMPAMVNVAALALLMRRRLVLHRLSRGAARIVHETDLHSLPGEPPRLLRGPWIAQAREPERERLFGATASLAGYPLDGALYLLGADYPDGIWVARWQPHWGESDLEAGMPAPDGSPLVDDVDAHRAWAREAARFALMLGLLLDAEQTPVEVEPEEPRRRRERRIVPAGARDPGAWTVRRVYLDRREEERTAREARARSDTAAGQAAELAGRHPEQVAVRGHLRRQPFGPGRAERRWVYVASYEARRWVAPRVRVDIVTEADG